jgi:hypothetical protein
MIAAYASLCCVFPVFVSWRCEPASSSKNHAVEEWHPITPTSNPSSIRPPLARFATAPIIPLQRSCRVPRPSDHIASYISTSLLVGSSPRTRPDSTSSVSLHRLPLVASIPRDNVMVLCYFLPPPSSPGLRLCHG